MNSALEKIPGQDRVKKTLNSFLVSKTIPHALLFTGIEGTGKDNAAIRFAQAVVQEYDSANAEKNSRLIEQLSEPQVKFIFPLPRGKNETESSSPTEKLSNDELDTIREQISFKVSNPYHKIAIPKATSIKINSIREIKKFLSLNFDEISHRFIIISDAHLMNDAAQNALLKNLEEPPGNVIFILTTSVISKLRQTIVSRCWRINFDPLLETDVTRILREYYNVDMDKAKEAASFSMGSVQSALNLVNTNITELKEKIISVLRYSFGRKYNSAFEELNYILNDKTNTNFTIIVNMMNAWINDLQKHRLGINNFYFKDHVDTLEKFNSKFPDVDLNDITTRLDNLSSIQRNNINPSLLSSSLIMELSSVVITS